MAPDSVLCGHGATVGSGADVLDSRDLQTGQCPLCHSQQHAGEDYSDPAVKLPCLFQRLSILCRPAEDPAWPKTQGENGTPAELNTFTGMT